MKTLLKNGTVLDYASNTNEVMYILISDTKIEKIGKDLRVQADNIIDCTNLSIMLGMIDMHCHLREPGFEYKETIKQVPKVLLRVDLRVFVQYQIQNQPLIVLLFCKKLLSNINYENKKGEK